MGKAGVVIWMRLRPRARAEDICSRGECIGLDDAMMREADAGTGKALQQLASGVERTWPMSRLVGERRERSGNGRGCQLKSGCDWCWVMIPARCALRNGDCNLQQPALKFRDSVSSTSTSSVTSSILSVAASKGKCCRDLLQSYATEVQRLVEACDGDSDSDDDDDDDNNNNNDNDDNDDDDDDDDEQGSTKNEQGRFCAPPPLPFSRSPSSSCHAMNSTGQLSLAVLPRGHPLASSPSLNSSASSSYSHLPQQGDSFYTAQRPRIDVDALAAGVQRYIPSAPGRVHPNYPQAHPSNSSYIALPPGVDPATVDFRTFYPYNPSEVKHRKRTTRPQLKVLEETFKKETKPNASLRKSLAAQLEMTPRGVQVWFQNRRAKAKNLAKKATSANGKSISLDHHNEDDLGDFDGDADQDDEAAVDNCDYSSHAEQHAPRMGSDQPEHGHSNSSSNSPESSSPELTPPTLPVDMPPHVNVSPPADEDDTSVGSDAKQDLLVKGSGVSRNSWNDPSRSMSRTPTYPDANAGQARPYGMNMIQTPSPDQFLRRPSLPTHLGIGPPRGRPGYSGSTRGVSMNMGMGGRLSGFDAGVRRMSLDRLASHPYAHLAAQANSVIYGPGTTRFRPTFPGTTHGTPTRTPQAHTSDLPQVQTSQMEANRDCNQDGHPELLLPPHLQQHSPMSPPVPEIRTELLHRQSLPAQFARPPSASNFSHTRSVPQSSSHVQMRFPRPGHVFALSARSYQPPIPGPLPNPNFSFGSPHASVNEEGEGASADSSASGSGTPGTQLPNCQFPPSENEKGDEEGAEIGMDTDTDPNPGFAGLGARSSVYYHDAQDVYGATDPYGSRFGSIASIASIAESESSATSGYFSEAGSFDVQPDGAGSVAHPPGEFNDARRPSCTVQVMGMFANLGMHNRSSASLSHLQDDRGVSSPHMPISRSSELALALTPDDGKSLRQSSGTNNITNNMSDSSDAMSFNHSHRSSLSSSDLSLGYMHSAPPSVNSSRSSLGMSLAPPTALPHLDTDKLDFMHNFDAVSETGHYSPVSHSGSITFDFPPSNMINGPQNDASASASSLSVGQTEGGMAAHLYTLEQSNSGDAVHQQQQMHSPVPPGYFSCGPFNKDESFAPSGDPSFPMHTNNVSTYGFYN
ncbi:hypothetical protein EW145_g2228 [Phellinidium pouzarii]|uniref:Homeobox domain-containing protein n=1 Tax=Phellinidium pouzarii TaxID=167371 RepID=A0A4S4LBU8_9AGAM|nr:hypothetical protein EW145_g2228 [Phellinidium pouzarii]